MRFALATMTDEGGQPIRAYPHHQLIAWALERDWLGHTVIIAPPGHAKTWWAGIFFSAWKIGNDPKVNIVYVSQASHHARKQSVAVRNTIQNNAAYRALFPHIVPDPSVAWNRDSWAVRRPATNDPNPTFTAYGIDGQILGARADYVIFDDVNTQQQQRSPTLREAVLETCTTTVMSRLKATGRAINIQTRWGMRDLAAWCIQAGWTTLHFQALALDDGPEQWATITIADADIAARALDDLQNLGWTVLSNPTTIPIPERSPRSATALRVLLHRRGPALWPEGHPAEELFTIRATRPAAIWACTYQGLPAPDEGNIIPVTNFQTTRLADLPRGPWRYVIQAWDTAFSTTSQADWSVGMTWALDAAGDFWLLDCVRRRVDFPTLCQLVVQTARRFQPDRVVVEHAASGISLKQQLDRLPSELRIPIATVRPDRDKVARAHAISPYADRCHVPTDAPWWPDVSRELALFPNDAHDDCVDALTLALNQLIPIAQSPPATPEPDETQTFFGNVWAHEW